MNNRLKLSPITMGLGVTMTLALPFASMNAVAADDGANVERIEVTGSRIKRTDLETASPVSVISADDISKGNFTSVADVLQRGSFSNGGATGSGSNNGGEGAARVDLRGLGAERTLVLLDGQRIVSSGVGANSSVDMNTIPVSMIKRIEVLKDGASAVYGSDAVSGVINIITKKDFDGLQVDASYGGTDEGDANTTKLDMMLGSSFDRGHIVLGASYVDRGDAMQSSRGYAHCLKSGADGVCPPGLGSSTIPGGSLSAGSDYMVPNGNGGWQNQENSFDYVPYSYLYTPQKRVSLFGNGSYDINDNVTAFTQVLYTHRSSDQQMAPTPVTAFEVPTSSVLDYDSNPAFRDSEGNRNNLIYKRRFNELGPRKMTQTVNTTQVILGLKGSFGLFDHYYDWDVTYNWGRNDATSEVAGLVNERTMRMTMDTDVCTDDPVDSNYGIACEPNWFNGGDLSQETLDNIGYTDKANGGNEMTSVTANISGDVFELPAGMMGFAAGAEYRREKGWFDPDSVTAAGNSSQSQALATSGSYDTYQAYVELNVPLLADLPGVQNLSLDMAGRWFHYSTFGDDSTWKLGLTWKINDELMLRGVRSTAFRAPTVSELYGGDQGSFDYVSDPCSGYGSAAAGSELYQRCDAQIGNSDYTYSDTQIENMWTSSDDLEPETADTWTGGIVYSPDFLTGFSATVDYYDIKIDNAISRINPEVYLPGCYNGNQEYCDVLNISRNSAGDIDHMESPLTNVGNIHTRGIDTNLTYAFDAAGLSWNLGLNSTYTAEYREDGENYEGKISGNFGGYARWRGDATFKVAGDSWDASWKVRYIGAMSDNQEDYNFETNEVYYHDVSADYFLNDSVTLTLGVDNLFDRAPAYLPDYSDSNTVPEVYDTLGRYMYAKVSWKI